jgi:uncharacterized membrane protein
MQRVEQSIVVNKPVRTVYNQWTQFQEFPAFMSGVKEVQQLDDTHLHWRASVWGREKEWDAEITEQEPDRRISWKSVGGVRNAGTVRFRPLGKDMTEVTLVMALEPETTAERMGSAMGVVNSQVRQSLHDFKDFVESHPFETGGWRGEVVDGRPHRRPIVHARDGWPMN